MNKLGILFWLNWFISFGIAVSTDCSNFQITIFLECTFVKLKLLFTLKVSLFKIRNLSSHSSVDSPSCVQLFDKALPHSFWRISSKRQIAASQKGISSYTVEKLRMLKWTLRTKKVRQSDNLITFGRILSWAFFFHRRWYSYVSLTRSSALVWVN